MLTVTAALAAAKNTPPSEMGASDGGAAFPSVKEAVLSPPRCTRRMDAPGHSGMSREAPGATSIASTWNSANGGR